MALLSGLAALLVPPSAGQKSEPPRGSADATPSRSLRIVSIVPVSMLTLSGMDPDMFFHMEAGMAEADEVLGALQRVPIVPWICALPDRFTITCSVICSR